jgi:zinc transporter, ZIP family
VLSALGWGIVAASSLLIGALIALRLPVGHRTIGLVLGFGAGVLISAVSFDLVEEAVEMETTRAWPVAIGIFMGCGTFFGGDWLIDRMGVGTGRTCTEHRRTARRSRSCSERSSTGSRSRW